MLSRRRVTLWLMLTVLAIAAAACGGGTAAPAEPAAPTTPPDPLAGWVEYTAPDGRFTARLPEQPEVQEQTVPTEAGDIQIVMYLTEDSDGALILSHNELPAPVAELVQGGDPTLIKTMLDGGRDGAMANVSGAVTSEQDITVDGMTGRDIVFAVDAAVSPTGQAIDGRARILVTPDRLWQAMVLANQGKLDAEQVDAFFEAFKIAPTPQE